MQLIRYCSGKGGTGPERELTLHSVPQKCVQIFMQILTLLRFEVIMTNQPGMRHPFEDQYSQMTALRSCREIAPAEQWPTQMFGNGVTRGNSIASRQRQLSMACGLSAVRRTTMMANFNPNTQLRLRTASALNR